MAAGIVFGIGLDLGERPDTAWLEAARGASARSESARSESARGEPDGPEAERPDAERLAALTSENRRLRILLAQAAHAADAEQARSGRLGRLVQSERSAGRVEADRFRRDLADGAARLASAVELNRQLRASEEFTRRILWTTQDCVKVLDLGGRVITLSENAPAVFGVAGPACLVGLPWADLWACPDSRDAVLAALEAARAGRPSRFQATLGRPGACAEAEGATWWDIAVTPIDGADGRPERILAVSRDITDLKRTEARQTLLMQELAHRMKNTLTLVQAVAAQTLRNAPTLDAAGEALSARLLALAQAHDVLLQGAFAGASLSGLVEGAVALHGDGAPGRFRVAGPDVTLGPRPGLMLALMLHELGTNAAKHGALSAPGGRVAVTWDVTEGGAGAPPVLRLRWEESGGPPVRPPTRTGFGTRLIQRSLAHSFGGAAALAFPETGVVLTLEAELTGAVAA